MRRSSPLFLGILSATLMALGAGADIAGPALPEVPAPVAQPAAKPTAQVAEVAKNPAPSPAATASAVPATERRSLGAPKSSALLQSAPAGEASPKSSASSSLLQAGSWERTVLSLAAVLGLMLVVMRLIRRYAGAQGLAGAMGAGGRAPSGVLEVLGRYPIARGQMLVLLRLDRRVLLCCHTRGGKLGMGGGMTVLTELTDPEEVATILVKTRDVASESIAQRFQAILSRSEHDADRALAHAVPARDQASPKSLPKGEAGRAAAYGLDVVDRPARQLRSAPTPSTGADAADAIRRRLAAMRAQGVTA